MQEIEFLAESRDWEPNKEAKKPLKKRLDLRRRELQTVEDFLSQQEHLLGLRGRQDSSLVSSRTDPDVIVESEMVKNMEAGVAPSWSTTQESMAGPPEGEPDQAMETEPRVSPMSANEDDLLSGATAAGVEVGLASLWVTSLPEGQGANEEASM